MRSLKNADIQLNATRIFNCNDSSTYVSGVLQKTERYLYVHTVKHTVISSLDSKLDLRLEFHEFEDEYSFKESDDYIPSLDNDYVILVIPLQNLPSDVLNKLEVGDILGRLYDGHKYKIVGYPFSSYQVIGDEESYVLREFPVELSQTAVAKGKINSQFTVNCSEIAAMTDHHEYGSVKKRLGGVSGGGTYKRLDQNFMLSGVVVELLNKNADFGFIDNIRIGKHINGLVGTRFDKVPIYSSCFKKNNLRKIDEYIDRTCRAIKPLDYINEEFTLEELIRKEELKNVLLIDTGGSGKSMEMERMGYVLSESKCNYFPVYIALRLFHENIFDIIKDSHDYWDEIVKNEIVVVLLDGLDEVPKEKLLKCIEEINLLTEKSSRIKFVLSSRQNTISELYTKGLDKKFEKVNILELSESQCLEYLDERLNSDRDDLIIELSQKRLIHLLNEPYFLRKITECKNKGFELPMGKIKFIELILKNDLIDEYEGMTASQQEFYNELGEERILKILAKLALFLIEGNLTVILWTSISDKFSEESGKLFHLLNSLTYIQYMEGAFGFNSNFTRDNYLSLITNE